MSEIFVASDHHFDHKNILKFQPDTREFNSVQEMNEGIIERHNSVVNPDDEVYFLGDFAFCQEWKALSYLKRLNGRKYFIFGNHDKVMRSEEIQKEFVWMRNYYELRVPGHKKMAPIVLFHYPIYSWNRMHYGALHFYGHTHSSIPTMAGGRGMDVGLDSNNCYPWNVEDLIKSMSKMPIIDSRDR